MNFATEQDDKPRRIRTVFMLDPDLREGLEKQSADSGATISELIRRSIKNSLHRERVSEQCGSPTSGPMFKSKPRSNSKPCTPLNMNNVLNRMILPALNRCEVCRKEKVDHAGADHEYKRDASRPMWHGWHAFRRGLATNLHRLGVNDKTIQAILRNSNIQTTQNIYIKTVSSDSVAALKLLETVMCTNCAPEKPQGTDVVVQ